MNAIVDAEGAGTRDRPSGAQPPFEIAEHGSEDATR